MSSVSTHIPKGPHAPPLIGCHGCQGVKALSTMFLTSRLEISSHAAFAEGSNLDMIGLPRLGTPQSCTCCHRSNNKFA